MFMLKPLLLRPVCPLSPLPPEGARCMPKGLLGGPPTPFPPSGALDMPLPLPGEPIIFPLPTLAIPAPGLLPGTVRGPCSVGVLLAGANGEENPEFEGKPPGGVRSWLLEPWRLASNPRPGGLWVLVGVCWAEPLPAKGEMPTGGVR